MPIPTLSTARLILRAPTLADFPACAAERADPVVMRYMGKGDLLSEEESWTRFVGIPGHWRLLGHGTWALGASAHGKGYATEAARAALACGRDFLGPGARTVCVISDDNAASIRVARKCGFRQFATASRYGLGRLVFEREL